MSYSRYLLIFITLICWGTYSLFLKMGIRESGYPIFSSLIAFMAASAAVLILVMAFSGVRPVSGRPLLYLIIGGTLLGIGSTTFLIMLEKIPVSVARPLLGLNILIAVLTGVFFLGEHLTLEKWIGIGLAVGAIVLLSK